MKFNASRLNIPKNPKLILTQYLHNIIQVNFIGNRKNQKVVERFLTQSLNVDHIFLSSKLDKKFLY